MIWLAIISGVCAALPAIVYARNRAEFCRLPPVEPGTRLPAVSVLIPARNEARNIASCVEAILSSTGVPLEVVVLDDNSTDDTPAIVRGVASADPRVRLICGEALPPGWNGKQHACWQLAQAAQHEVLVFLDADVRLAPDALRRSVAWLIAGQAALVSGFPHQRTASLAERMLLPLLHFVLLGFLPLRDMRQKLEPAYGAGCGQWFVTRREAYFAAGGHAAIRHSRHDGLMLPRLYRRAGLMTDIFDATDTAECRMYDGLVTTWRGLAKNATEGIASLPLLPLVTVLLGLGQVAPLPLAALCVATGTSSLATFVAAAAVVLSYGPRLDAARRFRQSWLGAALHPLAIAMFLVIQWEALARAWVGRPVAWKDRGIATPTTS